MKDNPTKPKRRLTDIDFSTEGSHIALVHKEQGGAANGYATLVTKATDFSKDFLEKAAKVKVTLSFEEFLSKFFGLWTEDAKVLATLLGLQEADTDDYDDYWYKDYITEQVDKFEIMKSLHESDNIVKSIIEIGEKGYLELLKTQEKIEKSFIENAGKSGLEPKTNIEDDSMGINKANTAIQTEETNMPNSENITKAQYEDIQKSLDELKKDNESKTQELQKAAELLKHYKDKEEAAISKARKESLVAVVEVEEQAEKLFKAVASLDEQQFQDVVEVLKSVSTKEDDFFVEKGATAVTDTDQNYLRDILIQKHKQA